MTAWLCDTNVWVALAIEEHRFHDACLAWLATLEDEDRAIFCRFTQHSFVRLLTNAAVLRPYRRSPLTNRDAWAVFEAMREDDRVGFDDGEPPGLQTTWLEYALRDTASTDLWGDAYLAAFASRRGYRFVTADAGFRQFNGLDLLLIEQR